MFSPLALASGLLFSLAVLGTAVQPPEDLQKRDQLEGVSISFGEDNTNWQDVAASGHSFAYVVASGGFGTQNPDFSSQFADVASSGLFRGAYHIAIFSQSSGADQANFFISNGGNKIGDGVTLPGAIKVGYDTDDEDCYHLNSTSIVSWIHDFSNTYYSKVQRYPLIHTTARWWNECTNSNTEFGSSNPLWLIQQGDSVGSLPVGWSDYTFWQYGNPTPSANGKERFNGDKAGLQSLASS